MNKIININLGGFPFVVDEEAFDHLQRYLKALTRHISHSEGCEEIISDIENRMAELFNERLGVRKIVTLADVQETIKIMGRPEDFQGDILEDEPLTQDTFFDSEPKTTFKGGSQYRTGKRLFRNKDEKVIAGVCSGIAAYFGIEDPVWVRIAFVLATITGGFGVLAYLILAAIVPPAKSAADRLSMRGEPINVSSIAKQVEEEINSLSDTLADLGNQISGKKKIQKMKEKIEMPLRRGFMY